MPRHPPNAQKNKQQNTTKHTDNKARMPQSQKQYSNNARVHYTVHNQPTHTHPQPPTTRSPRQVRQPGRTAPEPRQHATPHTHTSTHKRHPPPPHNRAAAGVSSTPSTRQPTTPGPHHHRQETRATASRPSAEAAPRPARTQQTAQARSTARKPPPHKPILRKEVIQPHLPVRLPCYDFVPITSPTFDRSP